jgi:hypothetical protein
MKDLSAAAIGAPQAERTAKSRSPSRAFVRPRYRYGLWAVFNVTTARAMIEVPHYRFFSGG